MTRFLKLAPCALLAAGLGTPAAWAQDAAYQSFEPSRLVQPGQLGQINPHQPGGALACPSIGVLASLYNQETLATGGNSNPGIASAQIAAARAGCVTLPPAATVQVLSFYQLRATTQKEGAGYLQIQSSTTGGAQWIGAGAVVPLPANQSGPPPSAFGAPIAQPAAQPQTPPASPPTSEMPQNNAPSTTLPTLPQTDQHQNANPPDGYVPLPTLPPSSTPPNNPSGACSDINSLINAAKSGQGCTQP